MGSGKEKQTGFPRYHPRAAALLALSKRRLSLAGVLLLKAPHNTWNFKKKQDGEDRVLETVGVYRWARYAAGPDIHLPAADQVTA